MVNVDLTPGDTVDEVSILANLGPIAGAMREKDGSPSDRRQMLGAFKAGLDEFVTPDGVIIPSQLNLFWQ